MRLCNWDFLNFRIGLGALLAQYFMPWLLKFKMPIQDIALYTRSRRIGNTPRASMWLAFEKRVEPMLDSELLSVV